MPEFYNPYNHSVPKVPEHILTQATVQKKSSGKYYESEKQHDLYREPRLFNRELVLKTLSQLALKNDMYVVIGGASLVLRDIKEKTEDIDMLVSEEGFEMLADRIDSKIDTPPMHAVANGATNETIHVHPRSLMPVSAFTYLNGNGYYPMTFESVETTSQLVSGVPLSSIEEVVASKQALGRYKDTRDLMLIAAKYGFPLHIPAQPIEDDLEYA